jgi:hypothetical protein
MSRLLLILLAFGPALCQAEPYWVSWESGWPEEQGWGWGASDPPPERWLDDGTLYIDSRAAIGIWGGYYRMGPGMFSLEPGETFIVQWRARVSEATYEDAGVIVVSDDQYGVDLIFGPDRVHSGCEPALSASFTPDEFHDFRLESDDFRAYRLFVDGSAAFEGNLFESTLPPSHVSWGDLSSATSLNQWDSFEYGIVPEPGALVCLLFFFCAAWLLKGPGGARRALATQEELR